MTSEFPNGKSKLLNLETQNMYTCLRIPNFKSDSFKLCNMVGKQKIIFIRNIKSIFKEIIYSKPTFEMIEMTVLI